MLGSTNACRYILGIFHNGVAIRKKGVLEDTNALQVSPRSLYVEDCKPIYAQKRVLGPKCPNMVIRTHTPKLENFLLSNTTKMSDFGVKSFLWSHESKIFINLAENAQTMDLSP